MGGGKKDFVLQAQTIAEIGLYFTITGCEKCGLPVQLLKELPQSLKSPGLITAHSRCTSCGSLSNREFQVAYGYKQTSRTIPPPINPTDRPSSLIDLGQWITLGRLFVEESRSHKVSQHARYHNLTARQCYEEALKFYDDPDNDLPPQDAFFCASSRRRFRESPEQFSRSRLIGEKSKLPYDIRQA